MRQPPTILATWWSLLLCAALAGCAEKADERSDFARAVDLDAFGKVSVQSDGRLKSFDSFARSMIDFVTGPRRYSGQSASFTYLDLAFRPSAYSDADVLYVKNKAMRVQIVQELSTDPVSLQPGFDDRMSRFVEIGLISPRLLTQPVVLDLVDAWRRDLVRTAKFVNMLESALNVMRPEVLNGALRVVAPPGGTFETPWLALAALGAAGDGGAVPEPLRGELASAYASLQRSWAAQDAGGVNLALATLAERLPRVNPELYPSTDRLAWESWYFRARSMTWVWLLYMPAVVVLLLSLVYRWTTARRLGLALFAVAFGFHTFALGLRWYVSGRWPNSNMFEAVTTAAWFGGAVALACEWVVRGTAWRNVFALGSAVASMVALMAAHFLPVALTPNISNKMPVLHDVWLYIHTNVIIASYCLIFMAAVSGLLYLGHRLIGGAADHVRLGGAGTLIAAGQGGTETGEGRATVGQVMDGVTMVLMELSFVMLWAGLVMGAIWADHSWGRPWGWDPKEVFALNTFLVFAVLVHVRLKSRDKGLWTAVLAVVGAGVMLFNWIVINFVITGLHSYA